MLATQANPSTYNSQRTVDTVLVSGSCTWFAYLSVNRRLSTILSQFLIFCLTSLLTLLQTMVLYLISHSPANHITSIHYLWTTLLTLLLMFLVIVTKYVILDNLSYTTSIISFSAINSNFVTKSTVRCIHSFSSISFTINFPMDTSVLLFIL